GRPARGNHLGGAQPRPWCLGKLSARRSGQGGARVDPRFHAGLHDQRGLRTRRPGLEPSQPWHDRVRDGGVRQPGERGGLSDADRRAPVHRRTLTAVTRDGPTDPDPAPGLVRSFISRPAGAAGGEPDNSDVGLLRPYLLTAGRVTPVDDTLEMEAQVLTSELGRATYHRLRLADRRHVVI